MSNELATADRTATDNDTTTDTITVTASTETAPTVTGRPRRSRVIRVVTSAILALTAVLAALVGASPANASVSALSYYPTFECYSNALNIDQVSLNQGIGTVRVEPEIDVWNGSSWVLSSWGAVQSVNTNLMFSELTNPSWSFNASHARYFKVEIWTSVNGAAWTYYPAQAMRDHTSTYVCATT